MTDAQIIAELRKRWVGRGELSEMLGVSDERARQYIAGLNLRLAQFGTCIISTAARRGYHIPDENNPEDISLAQGAADELESKAISIFERRKVINSFLKKVLPEAEPRLFD